MLTPLTSVDPPTRHPHTQWASSSLKDNVLQRTDTAISALPLFYLWIYVSLPSLPTKWWKIPRHEQPPQWFGFVLDYVTVTVYNDFSLATVHAYCDGGVLWKYFMLMKIIFQQAVRESRCFVGRFSSCFLMPLFLVDWSFLVSSVSPLYPTHLFWAFSIFNKQRIHW